MTEQDARGMDVITLGDSYTFKYNDWICSKRTTLFQEIPAARVGDLPKKDCELTTYTVSVYTGDPEGYESKYPGTDANVYLRLYGEKGDTGKRALLKSSEHRDKFEKDKVDIFEIQAVWLGSLRYLTIGHDNASSLKQSVVGGKYITFIESITSHGLRVSQRCQQSWFEMCFAPKHPTFQVLGAKHVSNPGSICNNQKVEPPFCLYDECARQPRVVSCQGRRAGHQRPTDDIVRVQQLAFQRQRRRSY